jgi:hypothetical protein
MERRFVLLSLALAGCGAVAEENLAYDPGLAVPRDHSAAPAWPAPRESSTCDVSDPPRSVSGWIDESWAGSEEKVTNRSGWLFDAAMKGQGELNVCVRWGATVPMTTAVRDQIGPALEKWFNLWFALIYPYDCFPYSHVKVRVSGYAVRPGQEALLPAGTWPVYTETDSEGEPKCPRTCGFFLNWSHQFPECPGGQDGHFDYALWIDDKLPSVTRATAVGGEWGLRMPVRPFLASLSSEAAAVVPIHEIGHGFGLPDYYTWKGPRPPGGSVMIVGSADKPTPSDQWILRRYWKETKARRYARF